MKKTKPVAVFIVSAIMQLICAGWNAVWLIIISVVKVVNMTTKVVDSVTGDKTSTFDITNVHSWAGLINTSTIALVLHDFLVGIAAVTQVIAGITAIIFAVAVLLDRKGTWSGITVIIGIISCIVGLPAAISLCFVTLSPLIPFKVLMFFTLLIVPVFYTVYAVKFCGNLKSNQP
ncbi:MAG: hypothetical protein K2M82_04130 [Lachnospiraceae bacterium]|nr:hypothetical protein [Lachnospiraceae bacterium]